MHRQPLETSLDPKGIRNFIDESHLLLPVGIGHDIRAAFLEVVHLLRFRVPLRPVRYVHPVIIGILIVDEGDPGAHDVPHVVAQSRRKRLEEVEYDVERVKRPEDRDVHQPGVSEKFADERVSKD